MFYDSLLLVAIFFVGTAFALLFNHGEAIQDNLFYNIYLITLIVIFYCWFWERSGQTLGMRAWKIRIITEFGRNPSWAVGFLRLIFAVLSAGCFGIGYWWRLFQPYTWHDRLSQTRIIDLSA